MPYKATIKTGVQNVIVGGKGPYNDGDVVFLTDDDMANLRPGMFTALFTAAPTAVNSSSASPYP